jgi:hypothetical protein
MNESMKKSPRAAGQGNEEAGGSVGVRQARTLRPGYTAGVSRPAVQDVVTSGYGCLIAQASRKNGCKAEIRSGSHG